MLDKGFMSICEIRRQRKFACEVAELMNQRIRERIRLEMADMEARVVGYLKTIMTISDPPTEEERAEAASRCRLVRHPNGQTDLHVDGTFAITIEQSPTKKNNHD